MRGPFTLTLTEEQHTVLFAYLFPGDDDEHGTVIAASVVITERGTRLIARDVFLAEDGIDYVPGQRGYRMLTASFVSEKIRYCRDQRLAYLAVHNHGGDRSVRFSSDDLASHERGYPALSKISRGQVVGGLVFAKRAVAGDLWLPSGTRVELEHARLLGPSVRTIYPKPPVAARDTRFDRQARLFGDEGQRQLSAMKVGVIGAGGAGSLLVEYLARLGVGHLVVADYDRVDLTNVPRITGATYGDARAFLTNERRPRWIRQLGKRLAARKIDVMRRIARRANPLVTFEGIFGDVCDDPVARRFIDCDYIFLAADSFSARLVFNAIVHQYLIPGAQVGAKVPVDKTSGDVGEVMVVVRPLRPGENCLWCAELIPAAKLTEEASSPEQRTAQRYVEDTTVHAPSVITLNAVAASAAADGFLFTMLGLTRDNATREYMSYRSRRRTWKIDVPRRDDDCPWCSPRGALGRGDAEGLPTRPPQKRKK
jgi:molybdopterin/thiamine biosynthesis adenylyltransferase